MFLLTLADSAQAAAHSCPNKLSGVLWTDDQTLRPSEVTIIYLDEIRYDIHLKRLAIASMSDNKPRSIRLDAGDRKFPIPFEFDISDIDTCPLGFSFLVRGDTAAQIGKFHFSNYPYQMTGQAFTIDGTPTSIWVRKSRSSF